MLGKPGPFQVIEEGGCGAVEDPVSPPRRRFSCKNYELCLNLAAALNWDNFTCRGCCEEVNKSLLWRARQALKKDNMACRLCDIPEIQTHCTEVKTDLDERIAAKKVAY